MTTSTPPPPAPTLNGFIIGQAERATRALLDRLLDEVDTPFETWVVLNLLGQAGGTSPSDALIDRMVDGLRVGELDAWVAVDDARRRGLAEGTDVLHLTDAGQERFATITAGTKAITGRLYSGFPAEELEVAARILLTVTDRAKAELPASR
ncbi:MarR family transcriptional regulator [Aquihabitans sp. McL0605]|uniref:MarR family transcriptional regulator n=1 Tax=Aquihabitans sp. McL0605 TaxID=3415671 RepID=UPI003CEE2EBD